LGVVPVLGRYHIISDDTKLLTSMWWKLQQKIKPKNQPLTFNVSKTEANFIAAMKPKV